MPLGTALSGLLLAVSLSPSVHAQETAIEAPISRVALFKNGMAVVDRRVTVPGPGRYVLDSVPTPSHGTFWIESDGRVATTVLQREVDVSVEEAASLGTELVGQSVVVFFRDGQIPPVAGKVERFTPSPTYAMPGQPSQFVFGQPGSLVLATQAGRTYVDTSAIVSIQASGQTDTVQVKKPVLIFDVASAREGDVTLRIQYLTQGLSWAPSYRIDVSDPKRLMLEQSTVIRNELEDLEDVEVELISGFPNLEFAGVTSPIAAQASWAEFYSQVSNGGAASTHSVFGNRITTQQTIASNFAAPSSFAAPADLDPDREGVDIHYQSAGRVTLERGAAINLPLAVGGADYQRIVSWKVPDTRNPNGRRSSRNTDDSPWDALRFRNPLKIPMTTAPALMVESGRLLGQSLSTWVNPGAETTVQITKALSVQTRSLEVERQSDREVVYIGGESFWRTEVDGELVARNYRSEPVTFEVRCELSGELLEATEGYTKSLLESGVYSVNRRNELVWSTTLDPGEERRWTYRYRVLVDK